jgi:AraC-like DNA-binding protein
VKHFWKQTLDRVGDPLFPLRLAETLPFGAGDLIDYLIRSSATVGAALQSLTRYTQLMTNTERMVVAVSGREASMRLLTGPDTPHPDELVLGLFGRRTRETFGPTWAPKRFSFAHEARGPRDTYERVCQAPVAFDMPYSEVVFDRELLDQPMAGADSGLHAILTAQADSLLVAVAPPPPPRSFAETIERGLADRLRIGDLTLAGLADHLGVGVRTLQRRLRAEGLTHRKLVRHLRHTVAVQSLTSAVPQKQIARRLGYSGTGAFQRAFKAWSGLAPAEVREQAKGRRKRAPAGRAAGARPPAVR